jgi:hypothetical protein
MNASANRHNAIQSRPHSSRRRQEHRSDRTCVTGLVLPRHLPQRDFDVVWLMNKSGMSTLRGFMRTPTNDVRYANDPAATRRAMVKHRREQRHYVSLHLHTHSPNHEKNHRHREVEQVPRRRKTPQIGIVNQHERSISRLSTRQSLCNRGRYENVSHECD